MISIGNVVVEEVELEVEEKLVDVELVLILVETEVLLDVELVDRLVEVE